MLETIIAAALTAAIVSAGVGFAMQWQTRLRVRRMGQDIAEFDEIINRYNKRRAAEASVASRQKQRAIGTDLDAALVARHTGVTIDQGDDLGGMADFVASAKRGERGKPS